jgi:glutathione peroxidase-family protein
MTMKYSKIFFILGITALIGCNKQPTFSISGTLNNEAGKTVYLEHTALKGTTIVDSCTIDKNGKYSLTADAPEYPDFYRLRIGNNTIPFAVDSTENIQISGTLADLPSNIDIVGSETSKLITDLRTTASKATREEIRQQAKQIIATNPGSSAAYYAVFLKQNGQPVWDISNPTDRRMFQAVATSFDLHWPEYERSKALCNQVLEYLQVERSQRSQQAMQELINASENTFLDITLPDEKGNTKALSTLRGKVIILDFSTTKMEQYVAYNFELRELYNKYNNRGLTVYSVGIEHDKQVWTNAVENLPWTTVYADATTSSSALSKYNVQSLPTLFLIDKKGNVQGRYTDFKSLETDIKKYL